MQTNALFLAGLCQFFYHIASEGRGLHYVIFTLLGIPHGKPIVMATGKADIFCSGFLKTAHPLACVKAMGIEGVCGLGIFIAVGDSVLKIPLALGKCAVNAPMEEYSQFHIPKLFTGFEIGFGRFVFGLCAGAQEGRQTERGSQ